MSLKKGILVNKTQLIDAMSARSGLTKTDATKALDAMMGAVTEAIARQETVSLIGFLVISVKKRLARIGRNPQTNKEIHIPEAMIPVLKAGKTLKDAAMGRVEEAAEAVA